MTAREILKILHRRLVSNFSKRLSYPATPLRHKRKKGRVTVPNHSGDLPVGTVHSIYKQAGLK